MIYMTILFWIMAALTVFWILVVLFNILEWMTQKGEDYIPFPKEWSFVLLIHILITLFIRL